MKAPLQRPTPTSATIPGQHGPTPISETTTIPGPDPEQKENNPVYDSDSVQRQTPGHRPDNFPTTLITQTRRVGDVMAEITRRVADKAL